MAKPPSPGPTQPQDSDPLDPPSLVGPPGSATVGEEVDEDLEEAEGADEAPEEEARRQGGKVGDMLRKAVAAGLGAVFMTEEGIRALVKDLKLPKDVVGYALSQAERSKAELLRIIGEEARRFFESAALRREFLRLLSDVTIEIKADVRLRPDGQAPEIKVRAASARRPKRG